MRAFPKPIVLALAIATVGPQLAAGATELHLLLEHGHGHEAAFPIPPLVALLHGHPHSGEAPDHEHQATPPPPNRLASHARATLVLLPVEGRGVDASRASGIAWPDAQALEGGPPPTMIPAVLRI